MLKIKSEIESKLLAYYESIIRNGKTHDEALQDTAKHCYQIANQQNGLHVNKESKGIIENTSKKIYGESLLILLSRWGKQTEKENLPTGEHSREVMTLLSNTLIRNYNIKQVIDPAAGLGILLTNIDANEFILQDRNERFLTFAENYHRLLGHNNIKTIIGNSLDVYDYDIWHKKGLYIFDPPIGGKKYPKSSALKTITNKYLNISQEDYILPEIHFLLNYLAFANEDSFFICKMPNSILTSRQNDLDNLRKHLIENSLIAAIKDYDGFIILLLKKNINKDSKIYTINYDESITEEILDYVIKDDYSNIKGSIQNINILEREKLVNNIDGSVIYLPMAEIDIKKYKEPIFYFNNIINTEQNITEAIITIRNSLISNELIFMAEDEKNNLDNIIETKENLSKIDPIYDKSILSLTYEIIEEDNNSNAKTNDSESKYWYNSLPENHELYETFNKNFLLFNNYELIEINANEIKTSYDYISHLYSKKLLKFENGKLYLADNFEQKFENDNTDYDEIIKPIKYKNSFDIQKVLNMLSENQSKIYYTLCKYWFNYNQYKDKKIFNNYSYAYIMRTIKTLEQLGLVKLERNALDTSVSCYDLYRPMHYLIDGCEEKE